MTVDFDPQQGMRRFRAKELTKSEIVSNFYANKAADHLIVNEASRAYAYLKAAINENVNNEGAWLNLGVLFSRHQHFDQAEAFYAMALSIKPNFTSAYENLALLYKRQGKAEKSQVLLSRLHKKRQKNPYYHMMLGDIALEANDYELSITHYKKAISLNHKPHEFHFSLAKVYFRLGDIENAHRYLENAKRWAWDRELKRQYSSKISNLVAKR
ncbi:MAG: tetratricopeptide (TPR) repeat protein [Glaciecola sp.]|jgi:tetratricopeptide (TPR) repeat protein